MCHGSDASGMMGMHPSLRGAVERLSVEGVEVTIRKGRRTMPPMPLFEGRLSDQQIDDVLAYIDSLPAGPRNFGPGSMVDDGPMMAPHNPGQTPDITSILDVLVAVLLVLLIVLAALGIVVLGRTLRNRPPEGRPQH